MENIFNYRDNSESKVGIGKIPDELQPTLDDIVDEYYEMIPDKSKTTHHTYYSNLIGSLKENFDKIQYNTFWNNICDNINGCIKQSVIEMNEIYYSNPKPNFEKMNLYGAAANLIPHRDCILYNFNGISFYRIIIGLTGNNTDTITEFINMNIKHKINKGDFMIFDFDKTLHQVIKVGQQEVPRILLKLHFIVCENCKYDKEYVNVVSHFYKLYYYVARYTEQMGTDPTTFMGFFYGLLWEWPFYSLFKYSVFLLFASNIIMLNSYYKIKLSFKNSGKLLFYSSSNIFILYLSIVSFYYFRYILYGIK